MIYDYYFGQVPRKIFYFQDTTINKDIKRSAKKQSGPKK